MASVAETRKRLLFSGAVMIVPTVVVWFGVTWVSPALDGMDVLGNRMMVALACFTVAMLFTLALMIEAISHMRLFTPSIDPLAAQESLSMRVDFRVLSNTLEQSVLFAPALFGLAYFARSGAEMRSVFAYTAIWIIARLVFWVSYHVDQSLRAAGLVGSAITLVILVWNAMRFAGQYFGPVGEFLVVALFSAAEIVVLRRAIRAGRGALDGN